MSKVIHVSTHPRYVVEYGASWSHGEKVWTEWEEYAAYADREEAVIESDRLAAADPARSYRVVDTWEDE